MPCWMALEYEIRIGSSQILEYVSPLTTTNFFQCNPLASAYHVKYAYIKTANNIIKMKKKMKNNENYKIMK